MRKNLGPRGFTTLKPRQLPLLPRVILRGWPTAPACASSPGGPRDKGGI